MLAPLIWCYHTHCFSRVGVSVFIRNSGQIFVAVLGDTFSGDMMFSLGEATGAVCDGDRAFVLVVVAGRDSLMVVFHDVITTAASVARSGARGVSVIHGGGNRGIVFIHVGGRAVSINHCGDRLAFVLGSGQLTFAAAAGHTFGALANVAVAETFARVDAAAGSFALAFASGSFALAAVSGSFALAAASGSFALAAASGSFTTFCDRLVLVVSAAFAI